MNNIAIFASGSGSNAENIIKHFANHPSIQVRMVLSNKPNAYVIERCKKLKVKAVVFTPVQFQDANYFLNLLEKEEITFIVLAGFLKLIPSYLIKAFPEKMINIHPALLPKYGGKGMYGMKVHEAVCENKEKESGISIHYVNENYDEGNLIFQAKCPLTKDDSAADIAQKIHQLEYKYFPIVIEELLMKKNA